MQDHQSHDMLYLFGGDNPWDASSWVATDDRVRGGSSVSHLTVAHDGQTARFHGHLDTSTLGGAGFASQNTEGVRHWNLFGYDGLALVLEHDSASGTVTAGRCADDDRSGGIGSRADDAGVSSSSSSNGRSKRFALTLKDEIPGRRNDGRMRSGVSWEAEFSRHTDADAAEPLTTITTSSSSTRTKTTTIFLPWSHFEPTYRGRPKPDAKPLDLHDVKRIGLMMRSFFDEQQGDFEIVLRAIAAFKSDGALRTASKSEPERDGDNDNDKEEDEESHLEKKRDVTAEEQGRGRRKGKEGSWWRGVFCGLL